MQTDLCPRVRRALADPRVGAVGCLGARNVSSIAWWEGEVVCGNVRQRYEEHGGGEVPAARWKAEVHHEGPVSSLNTRALRPAST